MQISRVLLQASIRSNMHGHEDTMGLIDSSHMPYNDRSSLPLNFYSSSTTDLHGFHCTNNLQTSPSFSPYHQCTFTDMHPLSGHLDARTCAVYPFTDSKPFVDQQRSYYHVFGHSQGGLLDSPLVSSPVELPLSPPRTLPIGTRPLPADDNEDALSPFGAPQHFGFDSMQRCYRGGEVNSRSPSLSPEWEETLPQEESCTLRGYPFPPQFSPPETPSPGSSTDSESELPLETPQSSIYELPFDDSCPYGQDDYDDFNSDLLSSPCGRSLTDLPDFDETPPLSSPSPSSYLLNLPAELPDSDLLPIDLGFSFDEGKEEQPLLFSHEPGPPLSPSLEALECEIDPSLIEGCSDPDLQRLIELRRKSHATVQSARRMEEEMLQSGDYQGRTAAKRLRKREKDRAKEITSMLRLKLAPTTAEPLSPVMLGKEPVRTMSHLVAKMLFRRKDICKPMSPRYESWEEGDRRHSCSSIGAGSSSRKSPLPENACSSDMD